MSKVDSLMQGLASEDDKQAYRCLKQLEAESRISADVYAYFDVFAEMLNSDNSYIRTRGVMLISANAKWDSEGKLDRILQSYLKHIGDNKPIAARQCIKALPNIAKYKPALRTPIVEALGRARVDKYNPSMQPLLKSDIQKSLRAIRKLK